MEYEKTVNQMTCLEFSGGDFPFVHSYCIVYDFLIKLNKMQQQELWTDTTEGKNQFHWYIYAVDFNFAAKIGRKPKRTRQKNLKFTYNLPIPLFKFSDTDQASLL